MIRVLVLAALLVLAACARPAANQPAADDGPDVLGSWELAAAWTGGRSLSWPEGARATLELDERQVSGTSFCNRYAGDYRLDGYAITIGTLGGTEMACDREVMDAERAFLTALAAVENITRDDDALVLSSPDVSLTFTRQGAAPDRELTGTTWTLDTLVDGEVASSVLGAAMLQLAPDGTATGGTGCRGFLGTWQVVGDVLSLDLTRDDVGCPADLGRQDGHVLAVLDSAPQFAIDGDRLTLTAPDARALAYRAG